MELPSSITTPVMSVLGLLSLAVVAVTLTGGRLPLIETPRAAFIALVILGMSMCALGMRTVSFGWLNPFNVIGIVIGVLALAIAAAVLLRIPLPLIPDERAGVLALAAIMGVKVIIAVLRGIAA